VIVIFADIREISVYNGISMSKSGWDID